MRPTQSEIRPLPAEEFPALVNLDTEAYPGIKVSTVDEKKIIVSKFQEQARDPLIHFYGAYRNQNLVGVMRLHDFTMQCYEMPMLTGGVGSIAVDLLHKKEKIARDLMIFYLDHYYEMGAPLAILYPFRPDFYRKMGFGYGTKMNRYEIKPCHIPAGTKTHLRRLQKTDADALLACYQRVMQKTHGLIRKGKNDLNRIFDPPANHILGVELKHELTGYLVYKFSSKRPDNFIHNDMEIVEMVYENPQALQEMLSFLQSQADQIHDVIFYTQDEDFHHLFHDPRNPSENLFYSVSHETNTQGVGVMYRVINIRKWIETLATHDFNQQTLCVNVNIRDSFLPQNNGSVIVNFENGLAKLDRDSFDVQVNMDISDFSALAMGCVQFSHLLLYGHAEISDQKYSEQVNKLFLTPHKPICMTEF
jgi:predicted acetyltransferase